MKTEDVKKEEQKVQLPATPELPSLFDRIEVSVPGSLLMSSQDNLKKILPKEVINKFNFELLVPRVVLGSDWLDREDVAPDWVNKIDPDQLSFVSTHSCILAQATGTTYGAVLEKYHLDLNDAVAHGFHPGGPVELTEVICKALTIVWLTEIKLRQQEPPQGGSVLRVQRLLQLARQFFKKKTQRFAPGGLVPQPV